MSSLELKLGWAGSTTRDLTTRAKISLQNEWSFSCCLHDISGRVTMRGSNVAGLLNVAFIDNNMRGWGKGEGIQGGREMARLGGEVTDFTCKKKNLTPPIQLSLYTTIKETWLRFSPSTKCIFGTGSIVPQRTPFWGSQEIVFPCFKKKKYKKSMHIETTYM
jgi:hypothetical protein